MRSLLTISFLAALGVALSASPSRALTEHHRLSREVVPTSETVRLSLDAGKSDYSGSVRIALNAIAPTDSFQLYAKDMKLGRVALTSARGEIGIRFGTDEHGVLTVRASKTLDPGAYTLEIDFSNDFNTRASSLYRLETGGNAYTFTQLEAAAAREAFPCWDEPEFKIPWQIALVVPRAHLAVSNMPVAQDTLVGTERRVTFERTPPMSSYLLAIATGPLETVPIPGMSVPGRVVTVKGEGGLAGEAVKSTPPILAALEKYFGRRYPYPKLDLIAVPEFWPGAMENAGAVAFRDNILLLDPSAITPEQRRRLITVTAHELAHMWFGDLVTMKWWDDMWLNESFASWMGDKISDQVAPEFNFPIAELEGRQRAMITDARLSTRAIRQPVDGFDNLDQAADVLAYDKGQAVLGMLEQWLGADKFRQSVRDYLATHEWGNAVGADLWNALSKASGRDVAGPARSFLDQGGVPLVEAELAGGSRVRLRQSRFLNFGVDAPAPTRWQIPITIEYSDGSSVRTQSVLLTDSVQTVSLGSTGTIAWLYPNADERGYYRWRVAPEMLAALSDVAGKDLSARERVGFVDNLAALLDAGRIHGDEELRLLGRCAGGAPPEVVTAVMDALERTRIAFITPDLESVFAVYVRRTLGPTLARIGRAPAAVESEPVSLMRPRLLAWLGDHGRDAAVLERARALGDAYLKDPASVDPTLAGVALGLSALQGDAALFDTYRQRFEKAALPADRQRFLGALGSFRDTALVSKALAYALAGPLRPQEISGLLRALGTAPENADQIFTWLTRNYQAIRARIPPSVVHFLVAYAGGCSAARLEAGRAFFSDPSHQAPGMERDLARVTDQVHDCVGLREREGGAVARYLTSLAAAK